MDYKEADDQVFALVEKYGPEIFSAGIKSKLPNTMRAMSMFCAKANSLKTAMFDAIDSNNPYAFRVLYRCFCEHYLKFTYLWVRMSKEKTDAAGTEYYDYCGAVEAIEYGGALKMAQALLGDDVSANFSDAVARLYPEAAHLSKKELEGFSGKFKYRAILRYLATEEIGFVSEKQPFLSAILPAYALYSSFVHGGPYTDMEMFEYAQPESLELCESDVEVIMMMNSTVFMMTAIAAAFAVGSKEAPVAGKVQGILRRFSEENG